MLSSIGLISHSSGIISEDVARTSGSHVKILRMNLRDMSFSSPGGMVVTKSLKEVCGIGREDIPLP